MQKKMKHTYFELEEDLFYDLFMTQIIITD